MLTENNPSPFTGTESNKLYDGGNPLSSFIDSDPPPDPFITSGNPEPASFFDLGMFSPSNNSFDFSKFDSPETEAGAVGESGFYGTEFGKKVRGLFAPGTGAYNWGLRAPGTTSEQMFNSETPVERDTRMGNVGNAVGNLAGMMIPTPIKLGMSAYNAYKNGDSAGDTMMSLGKSLGGGLGSMFRTGDALYKGDYGSALANAVPGPLGQYGGMGIAAAQGRDITSPLAQSVGRDIGNQVAGPMGGMIGRYVGGQVASQPQQNTPGIAGPMQQPQQPVQNQEAGGPLNTLGQIAGLYNNYRQSQEAKDAAAAMKANIPDLNTLYGPGSAAYGELRKQLEAKDAAAGRRSQYGPREVELAARMAATQAQHAGSFSNANLAAQQAAYKAKQDEQTRQGQMLNNLFQIGKNTGMNSWLGDLFKNTNNTHMSDTPALKDDIYYG